MVRVKVLIISELVFEHTLKKVRIWYHLCECYF